ncbi:unnamed protein product [Lactuca saligna]|uniref:MBD domain-containing protein n=1 Tax=Lactuca saligna TaxID=75948 RepID=A0AA35Z793_LACSI|nr:unnamed protein product [Lactuca saligna]
MVIEKTADHGSSGGSGGDGSRSEMELQSLAHVGMEKMSQSELYTLSRCSSSAFDIQSTENVVIPNIDSAHPSTIPITTTTTTLRSKIYAFSHRRGHHRRISASLNDDADPQLTENRFILNFLEKLEAGGEVNDSNASRDMVAVADNEGGAQKRKRKRKSKAAEENSEEFEGLGVINVNGEEIDLKFLARGADGAFQAELNRMTEGMVREDEFLGFLKGLKGRWGSSRKRRRYVDAADFMKALPSNWKILLSLRPRARRPSLYCRRFVSPSDTHFKSCKEVSFYLKSLFATNDVNPIEGPMCQVDLESRMDSDTLTGKKSTVENSLKQKQVVAHKIVDLENIPMNGQGSSSLTKPSNEPKHNSEVKRNLKTRCMWCLVEFFYGSVDAESLAICPKCKEDIPGELENTVSRFYHHDNK